MIERYIICILFCIIAFLIAEIIFLVKNYRKQIDLLNDDILDYREKYEESLLNVKSINEKYSSCLDNREKFINDMNIKIKKFEIELESKDAEINRLNSILNYTKGDDIIAKTIEVMRDARLYLDISLTFANGITVSSTDPIYVDYSSNNPVCHRFFINKSDVPIEYYRYCGAIFMKFDKDDLSVNKDGYFIDKDKVRLEFDDEWQYIDADTDEKRALRNGISDFIDTFKIIDVSINKFNDRIRKLV